MVNDVMLYSLIILVALGVLAAILLYFVAQKFKVYEDPRIDEVAELLPGANCGGCGFTGCRALAEAIVKAEFGRKNLSGRRRGNGQNCAPFRTCSAQIRTQDCRCSLQREFCQHSEKNQLRRRCLVRFRSQSLCRRRRLSERLSRLRRLRENLLFQRH